MAIDCGADVSNVAPHATPFSYLPISLSIAPEFSGSDVLKAIALGARMVLVGRPFNYAAAVAGEAGVTHAIGLLRDEIDRNMAQAWPWAAPWWPCWRTTSRPTAA